MKQLLGAQMSDLTAAPSADSADPRQYASRIGYANRPGLTGLLVKNLFLTLVSLGFYRFWARVRLRRYFWSNILLAGEPLEYTGTGLELFIGFLIAIAIIAPLGIAYIVLQRMMLGNPTAEATLSLCYFLVLILFFQFVIYRARRYRLSRTAWRGIYAAQTGSAWRYLALSLLYGVLTLITLGLAAPWRSVALERYKIGHSWFGESRFSIDAKASDLFPRWLIVIALLVLPVLAFIAINLTFIPALLQAQAEVQAHHPVTNPPRLHALWLLALAALAGGPALIWYWVMSFRYLTSRTRLGEIRLLSNAKGSSVLKALFLFVLGLLGLLLALGVLLGIFVMIFGVAAAGLMSGKIAMAGAMPSPVIIGMAIILPVYLGMLVGFQLITYWWLRVPILRHLATTTEVENLAAIETIAQSAKPRQKFGIADSFDVGAI